ncbi:MAG TPA: ShlB/FhaC/HecB family hemolysin secretion/activation protein [Sphingomonadaceae bacterium]|nr:ShlB/FhaC/HecB family hemolysin secretion/activation protein [Sphingomonadaceae bacterium]
MNNLTPFAIAILATQIAASPGAFAQQPPNAGEQLRQIPPPVLSDKAAPDIRVERQAAPGRTEAGGATVRVQSVRVTGNTRFSQSELNAAAGLAAGRDLTLADLRAGAARISAFYNSRGYFLAQAYLPAQDVSAGAVEIAVLEGRYGTIDVRNQSGLRDGRERELLSGLRSGDLVANAPLERRLLLLSDTPGVRVRSTLSPGGTVGTSDLVVDLEPGRRVTGSVEADNAGNRYTGTYRAGGTINLNNPTGAGDLLSLRVLASEGGLAYGRAAYQAPVGEATIGVAFTHLQYELGREFRVLDGEGTADILSVFGSYPLIRSRGANLYALAGFDAKSLEDEIGLVSTKSDKRLGVANLGLAGDWRDGFAGGGSSLFSLGVAVGELDIRSRAEREADALTARSDGGFGKVQGSYSRAQSLGGPLSLYGSLRGQLAFDNLDSSEKIQLGGAYGVRAYPEGEAYGDHGYIATIEARLLLNRRDEGLPGQFQVFGFVDAGEVQFAQDRWFPGSNSAALSGAGAGLTWFGPHDLLVRGSYARKLSDAKSTSQPDKGGRAWFQIAKQF